MSSEKLNAIRDAGVCFLRRRIFIIGDIDQEMAQDVVTAVHVLDSTDGDIAVTLSSSGGSEPAGYTIYDALRLARNNIVVEGYGHVCSIAAVLLQAGDVRRLAPMCEFMIHNGSRGMNETMQNDEIVRAAAEIEFDNGRYRSVLVDGLMRHRLANSEDVRRLTWDAAHNVKDWCDQEKFFSAQEAVAAGFADEIIARRKK